ncbi:DegT/DnrJ/EryC1/StrS family aminotransferase [Eggerthella timonensis]|uniref:DegT/DnrJ/EryC1/StrS family aminotransferase n=1 Tax=Eggerthella timonensis TaxID=1871008 RepID=UPI000C77B7D8|nr:DegT/DnrJ/EryC1/StrS aminotransferase family protein [Eggerthella timonensis]
MEFIDLKTQYCAYKDSIDEAMRSVLAEAEFIGGRYVELFEEELAGYVGRKHCVTCGNGTDALQLAYMAYGIGQGDAVFCPDMTFIASVEPAVMLGATPVFCDIDPVSYNLSPSDLERQVCKVEAEGALTPKMVVAVDFLGNPADMDALQDVCEKHGLLLIEDAAQGIGGEYKGKRLGGFGDIATTSFFPSKPLGCYGDGGAVLTDDDGIAELLSSLRVHGKGESKYDNVRIGINSRLDNLQAAVLHVKLSRLEDEMKTRQEIALRYQKALGCAIACPIVADDCRSAYAQYVILAKDETARGRLAQSLHARGVPSLVYYPRPLHEMKALAASSNGSFPCAAQYARRNLGLPFSPFISFEDQSSVIEAVLEAIGG